MVSDRRACHTASTASMFVPILNIALGIGMIVGGATGQLALFGTGSSTALLVVGAICAALGIWQLVRALRDHA